jgi:hypothetical protein
MITEFHCNKETVEEKALFPFKIPLGFFKAALFCLTLSGNGDFLKTNSYLNTAFRGRGLAPAPRNIR